MSSESERARAELVAAEMIATTFGGTDDDEFEIHYDRLRDLIALGYLHGAKDAVTWAERLGRTL